ncbi:DUF2145 domain-containing protein [Rubrivivax rivuli]|uniref:DUF2145 domain-containing protein n=1 Tax=Rubrivivax rivuli TaxID=1862385 RepID=A0A437RLW3_9BURK|nr:DUF2145 domain-containing protein [Rubrivivax rivuli]
MRAALAALGLAAALCSPGAQATSLRACDPPDNLTAEQKDKIFTFGAVIKTELEKSGVRLALIARAGLDLGRFGVRYSHAGFSLKHSPDTPWAIRQLYYACDEKQPHIFDQGMLGFLLGMNEPSRGFVSVLLLPEAEAADIERAALDKNQALQLLGATYSANAYAFSQKYQNCNQWVAEVLAAARGGLLQGPGAAAPAPQPPLPPLRERAQAWLKAQGYTPSVIDVRWRPLMWGTVFVPWLNNDDHPPEDQAQAIYRVSMPAAIEAFLRQQVPGAQRLEFCHTERHVVVRRGWTPIAEGCVPEEGDTVVPLG